MFPRTFDQRRLWTRVAFLGAAALPTALVALAMLWRVVGGERQRLEQLLTRELGVTVSLEGVRHPGPRSLTLENVRLSDSETEDEIARVARIDVAIQGGEWVLVANGVELAVDGSQPLWDSLRRSLARKSEDSVVWHLVTREVVLRTAGRAQSLDDAHVVLQQGPRTSKLSVRAKLPNAPEAERLFASVSRNHESRPPTVRWELLTRDKPLPCVLLAPLADLAPWFGAQADFQGCLWITQQGDTYNANVAGTLRQIDLNQLITTRFPHTLRGEPGTLQIDDAHVQNGRLVKARGTLRSGPGRVSHSLVACAAEHLGLVTSAPANARNELLPFDGLGLQFTLNEQQLELFSLGDAGGPILASAGQPLLAAPPSGARVPPTELLRTLAPRSEHQAPATRETELLARLLPLPSVAPPLDARGQPVPTTAKFIKAAPTTR